MTDNLTEITNDETNIDECDGGAAALAVVGLAAGAIGLAVGANYRKVVDHVQTRLEVRRIVREQRKQEKKDKKDLQYTD